MVILDTDTLSILQRGEGSDFLRVDARLKVCLEDVFVTIVSFEEQMRGWLAAANAARDPESYAIQLGRLNLLRIDYQLRAVLLFDSKAVEQFKQLRAAKVRIDTMDLRIASVALANAATLVTRNRRDYSKVPGLTLEDWTVAPKA